MSFSKRFLLHRLGFSFCKPKTIPNFLLDEKMKFKIWAIICRPAIGLFSFDRQHFLLLDWLSWIMIKIHYVIGFNFSVEVTLSYLVLFLDIYNQAVFYILFIFITNQESFIWFEHFKMSTWFTSLRIEVCQNTPISRKDTLVIEGMQFSCKR